MQKCKKGEKSGWVSLGSLPRSPIVARRQRRGTRVDSADRADHPAVNLPKPVSRHPRSIVREIRYVPSLLVRGGTDNQVWQRGRSIGLFRRGDCNILRRGTLLTHKHGMIARRVSMRVFASCKQTEAPWRTPPSKVQPTVGRDQLCKAVPQHRCSSTLQR